MRGHITQRGKDKNTYSVVVEFPKDKITGKRTRKWFTIKGDKKSAERFLTEKLSELDNGVYDNVKEMYLNDFLEYWYKEHCLKKLAVSTYEGYKRYIDKYIIPYFGKIKMNNIKPLNVQSFYSYCSEKGLNGTSITQIHRILHSAFKQAVKWQIISKNVIDNVEPPKKEKFIALVLNKEQVKQLLEVAKSTDCYIPTYIAIATGMRRGEILALTWNDINFEKRTITVSKTLSPTKNGLIVTKPKTLKSNRMISVPPTLIECLIEHKNKQDYIKNLLKESYVDNNLVICTNNGNYFSPTKLNHGFQRLLKNNNLPPVRFHDLRHTHASLLISQDVHPKLISERLGHSTIGITMNLYSHVYDADNEELANNFDKFLK